MLRLSALVALALALLVATPGDAAGQMVGTYRSSDPGSVNTLWIEAPRGLVVVDAQRTLSSAREALALIRAEGRPVVAILVTHAHPDHVAGLGLLRGAFPDAPIHASAATRRIMRDDPEGLFRASREQLGDDFPAALTLPDRTFARGATLRLGGLRVRTAEFGPGEAESLTAFYLPASRDLLAGDVVAEGATPFLLEGRTCGWLEDLDRLERRFPAARVLHPGHGRAGDADRLVAAQRRYLHEFRRLVRRAIAPAGRAGARVTAAERREIVHTVERRDPGALPVAAIPDLLQRNVDAVAAELRAEGPRRPTACRGS